MESGGLTFFLYIITTVSCSYAFKISPATGIFWPIVLPVLLGIDIANSLIPSYRHKIKNINEKIEGLELEITAMNNIIKQKNKEIDRKLKS